MQKRFGILICLGLLLLAIQPARGQFREEAFSQQYNDDADTLGRDSTDVMFSFKDYFGGLRHKKEAKIGTMFAGSTLFVGGQQVYNRQYWKLPVIYGGLAATAGLGIHYRHRYNDGGSDHDKLMSNLMFAGTGLIYWGAPVRTCPGAPPCIPSCSPDWDRPTTENTGRSPSTTPV